MPNQYLPDLCAPPKSLSAHLKFGCLSVSRFYLSIQDTYLEVSVPVFVYVRDQCLHCFSFEAIGHIT